MKSATHYLIVAIAFGYIVLSPLDAQVTVELTLDVDPATATWEAYVNILDPNNATLGLSGIIINVLGDGGVSVISSLNELSRPVETDDFVNFFGKGFGLFRSDGTLSAGDVNDIGAAQDRVSNIIYTSGRDKILTHFGLAPMIEDNGILPSTSFTIPALIASGTYDMTAAGSLSIDGSPPMTTLIPPSYTNGQNYATFNPNQVTGMTIDLPFSSRSLEWALPAEGNFFIQGNWTLSSGSGPLLPDVGTTVQFNEAGSYRVDLSRTAQSDVLEVQAGDVYFNGIHSAQNYEVLTGVGDADVTISGGNLTLGESNDLNIPDVPVNLEVGDDLRVEGGSTLNLTNGSVVNVDTLRLADIANQGDGTIIADGVGSQFNKNGLPMMNIGQDGIGTLTYQNSASGHLGSVVQLASFAGAGNSGNLNVLSGANATMSLLGVATGGSNDTSSGNVLVDGSDAVLNLTGSLTALSIGTTVGGPSGQAIVSNGGVVNALSGDTRLNDTGTITVDGGTLNAENIIFNGGTLNLVGSAVNAETIDLSGGGTFNMTAGELTVDIIIGNFQSDGGSVEVGSVSGDLINDGGTVAPGDGPGIMTVNGNYTQTATGALEIEIGGTTAGSEYDLLKSTGIANLDGTLTVALIGSIPSYSDDFRIMTFASSTGDFATVEGALINDDVTLVPVLSPMDFTLMTTLPGDADMNDIVNFADFAAVANNFGALSTKWNQGNFNFDNTTNFVTL